MEKGEDVHKDQGGTTYDPFDFLNEFVKPINAGTYFYYEVYCPSCKKLMYTSNEPCRLLPLRPCSRCSK